MSNQTTPVSRMFTKESTNIAKGIAILMMLFYHLFQNPYEIAAMDVIYSPLSEKAFLMIAGFGNTCVSVFVFLTAYGISAQLFAEKEVNLTVAYRKVPARFGKLVFNFVFMYLIINLLWFKYFDYAALYGVGKQGILTMITDALGLSHLFSTATLNVTWWYMSIAYLLIFLTPLFACLCKKTGYSFIGIAFFLPFAFSMQNDLFRYFFVIAIGICAAYGKWFDKIINCKIPAAVRFILEIAVLVLSVIVRDNALVQHKLLYLADGFISFAIVLFAADFIGFIPVVRKVFAFLGKHSMNIFFTHTFFFLILYRQFIYHFRYAAITYFLLLGCSLVLSLLIEGLKYLLFLLIKILKRKPKAPEAQS